MQTGVTQNCRIPVRIMRAASGTIICPHRINSAGGRAGQGSVRSDAAFQKFRCNVAIASRSREKRESSRRETGPVPLPVASQPSAVSKLFATSRGRWALDV